MSPVTSHFASASPKGEGKDNFDIVSFNSEFSAQRESMTGSSLIFVSDI
ncbi:12171_t:CDS:2 [Rhizophagus irregularis]|nr:12171_t:CDS:2 [Rhizophagus irregularis]